MPKQPKMMERSRLTNEACSIACEVPECGRADRPLYVWHAEDGTGSMLICDLCISEKEKRVPTKRRTKK